MIYVHKIKIFGVVVYKYVQITPMPESDANYMDAYSEWAWKTLDNSTDTDSAMSHIAKHDYMAMYLAMGNVNESAESAEHVKRKVFFNKPMDEIEFISEKGDQLWYMANELRHHEITMQEVVALNYAKLNARYPDGDYTVSNISKDKSKEYRVMSDTLTLMRNPKYLSRVIMPREILMGESCACCGGKILSRETDQQYSHGYAVICAYCLTSDESLYTKDGSLNVTDEQIESAPELSGFPLLDHKKCYIQ